MQINRKTDVDRILKEAEETIKKQEQEFKNLQNCCLELFKDENGKYLLKFLKDICCWAEEDLNVNRDIIIYKKGRRDIWLILREFLPKDILAQVEVFE